MFSGGKALLPTHRGPYEEWTHSRRKHTLTLARRSPSDESHGRLGALRKPLPRVEPFQYALDSLKTHDILLRGTGGPMRDS